MIEQCISQNITSLRERLVVHAEVHDTPKTTNALSLKLPLTSSDSQLPLSAPILDIHETLANHHATVSFADEFVQDDEPDDRSRSFASRASIIRNHKSAGDVRSALKKFTPMNIDTRVLVRKESTFKVDATFHLSLTYEDSDPEDDNQIVPKMVSP